MWIARSSAPNHGWLSNNSIRLLFHEPPETTVPRDRCDDFRLIFSGIADKCDNWEEKRMSDPRSLPAQAMREIDEVIHKLDPAAIDDLADELIAANRIVCYGLGREGLMLRAFCMRLMHLGLEAHVAGDVTAPPVGPGDVLFISSGPGESTMARMMIGLGKRAAARVVVITAQPDGPDPRAANRVFVIPAQTMANDVGSERVLPMGTAFEIAMLIYLDLVAVRIRALTGQSMDDIRSRHTNLE
jgi:6-phospho-3-hexuloisomerase